MVGHGAVLNRDVERKLRVYPAECGQQLRRDPFKIESSKCLVLKSLSGEGTLPKSSGLIPSSLPRTFGHRCTSYNPNYPLPIGGAHRGKP